MQHKKQGLAKLCKRVLFITFGALLVAIGLEQFLIPNQIMDGGIVGLSIIMSEVSGWKIGWFLFLLNLPFFYIGYKQIGKTFACSTLYGVTVLSVATAFLHHRDPFTDDLLLSTFFGGVTIGAGIGIVIRYGGSLDGSETLAILAGKKFSISVGEFVMGLNVFVFAIGGFVFGWEEAMYSVLAYFIAFKTMDIVIEGLDESKSVWIISDNHREIGEAILARLGRGVTYLTGEGAFTGEDKKVIFCVITRLEESKLRDLVNEIDKESFLAIADISEVRGGRFKKKDIH